MGVLDFGVGENVMKRGLNGGGVLEKTPIKIYHSQETPELAESWERDRLEGLQCVRGAAGNTWTRFSI